jgi:predicted ATPase/transcriptional regulator with XRE-family HTH domain
MLEPGSFGAQLQQYRAAAGLSQEELAERAGLSRRGISDLERGVRRSPYPATVRRLAHALGLAADDKAEFLNAAQPPHVRSTLEARPAVASALAPIEGDQPASQASGFATGPKRHNLPVQLSSFVGRGQELPCVQRLLGTTRLLTLTGTGGVGKTRLALELASVAGPEFAYGSVFVNLTATPHPRLVLALVAQTLGVRDLGGGALEQLLIAAIAERSLLLLLDNCEHVVEAAPDVAVLLRACPGLKILATSREPLRLQAERLYDVPPLALPVDAGLRDPEHVSHAPAVELFVDRARAVNAAFRLDAATAPAVAELCRRLDGLPLAIELAASRIRLLPPAAMLARLEQRPSLLRRGARDLPARQHTLDDTMAWSYDLLDAAEQRLFRRLAVFVGGCTLDAAEAVCNAEGDLGLDILDGLGALVDKSLARRLDGADGE